MARSVYFSNGAASEQLLYEDIICESISIYGQDFYYIPRVLVAKDEILGEDRLSQFKTAYGIEMYLETHDGFEGQGAFIQKFGLMMEQSATLTVARRKWEQLIGRFGTTIIPGRPNEGDLLYFPLTGGLFEIKFVKHQDPFYQVGKLFVYKLQVELFQYASEKIDTGNKDIDAFESLKSLDLAVNQNGKVTEVYVSYAGSGYSVVPTLVIGNDWHASTVYNVGDEICSGNRRYVVTVEGTSSTNTPVHEYGSALNGTTDLQYVGVRASATATISNGGVYRATVDSQGNGYTSAPPVYIISNDIGTVIPATAIAVIDNSDVPESFGDNNKFKQEAEGLVFTENNPFGELKSTYITSIYEADTTKIDADSTITTTDEQ